MTLLAALIPQVIKDKVAAFVGLLQGLLQGETVLAIGNGAAVVIYLVAKAVKVIPDQTFEQAAGLATAAIVVLNTALLSIRQFVSSPATAASLKASAEWEHDFHTAEYAAFPVIDGAGTEGPVGILASQPAQDVVIDGDPTVSPDIGAE